MIAKRIFDLLLTLPAILLLLPVLAAIALWVWLDSKGPILFRQARMGRDGELFDLLKFRTMKTERNPDAPRVTASNDERITRSGRFLRHYKLDELPQLVNVIAGQMSLVGPRPEVPDFADIYDSEAGRRILSVKPGLTDIATLEFRNEESLLAGYDDVTLAYRNNVLPKKIGLQLDYVNRRSLFLDVQIIFRTLRAIFS